MPKSVEDLKERLERAVKDLKLSDRVSLIFYDFDEDIMTIELNRGQDGMDFYDILLNNKILLKNDQINITILK